MSSSLIEGLAYAATTTYMLFVSSMALAVETLFTSGVFCFFALAKAAMGSMNNTHSCPLGNCVYRLIRAVRTCWQVYFTSSPQGTGPLWNASCQWINSLTLYSNSNNHCYRTVNRAAQKLGFFQNDDHFPTLHGSTGLPLAHLWGRPICRPLLCAVSRDRLAMDAAQLPVVPYRPVEQTRK